MKKNMQNGITLVALVITVIILLVLAGISISGLTNTGLFDKTQQAVSESQKAQIMEEVKLAYIETQMEYYTKGTKYANEKEYLAVKFNNYRMSSGAILNYNKEMDKFQYIDKNENVYDIIIDDDGNATVLDENGIYSTLSINNNNEITLNTKIDYSVIGVGDKEITLKVGDINLYSTKSRDKKVSNTIEIENIKEKIKELKFADEYNLVLEVTNNNTTTSKTLKVTNYTVSNEEDVRTLATKVNNGNNFQGKTIYQICDIDLNGSESNQWIPIGTSDNSFYGTYNGGLNKIENIYINYTEGVQPQGFFGRNYGNISDVVINSGSIASNKRVGAVVGQSYGNIQRCINYINITLNSSNNWDSCGGIVGSQMDGSALELVNYGEISAITTGKDARIGGVVRMC